MIKGNKRRVARLLIALLSTRRRRGINNVRRGRGRLKASGRIIINENEGAGGAARPQAIKSKIGWEPFALPGNSLEVARQWPAELVSGQSDNLAKRRRHRRVFGVQNIGLFLAPARLSR